MRNTTKKIAAVAAGAVILTGTGVAYAYWTTSGSGSGTATATNNDSVANGGLTVTSNAPSGLVPGGTPAAINATVANLSGYAQNVGVVTATLTGVKNAAGASIVTTCGLGNFEVLNAETPVPVGTLAKAGEANASKTMNGIATIQLRETDLNQDACENAVPQFSLSAAVGS